MEITLSECSRGYYQCLFGDDVSSCQTIHFSDVVVPKAVGPESKMSRLSLSLTLSVGRYVILKGDLDTSAEDAANVCVSLVSGTPAESSPVKPEI